MSVTLEVVEDPAAACASMLLEVAGSGSQIVLTGGSTPRSAYERAALDRRAFDGTTLWFGDERCVPPEDQRSNYRMAKEALLDALGAGVVVHRIEGECGPFEAADRYEAQLREAGEPRFDLLLLGLGSDGHLASLFPDQEAVSERDRLVVGVPEAGLEPFVPRVSLTLPALASARRIVFLVSGASKAHAVAAAFGADAKPDPHVPASMLPPLADEIIVLLDPAAAESL
jgi:6-phosphogluconolactonase